jgi:hypothetical protein
LPLLNKNFCSFKYLTYENLEEMNRYLDTYDHAKLNQEDIYHLNISRTQNEIEAAIKSLPKKEKSRT